MCDVSQPRSPTRKNGSLQPGSRPANRRDRTLDRPRQTRPKPPTHQNHQRARPPQSHATRRRTNHHRGTFRPQKVGCRRRRLAIRQGRPGLPTQIKNASRDLQLRVASFSACASFPIHLPQKHVCIYLHSPSRNRLHLEHPEPRHRFPRSPVRNLLGRCPPARFTQAKFR